MSRTMGCWALVAVVCAANVCSASVVYEYTGNPFTSGGGMGLFWPGGQVTGSVTFRTEPSPNATLSAGDMDGDMEALLLDTGSIARYWLLYEDWWFHFDADCRTDQWKFGFGEEYFYDDGSFWIEHIRTHN